MGASIKQPSFSSGEVSPSIYGRVDLERYGSALRLCRNFIVERHGGVSNRPGTALCGETKTAGKRVRLIPFVFSDLQTYVLEFGDLYLRIYTQGARVLNDVTLTIFEIATPYPEADLAGLRFSQSADVVTLTHRNHDRRELRRLDNDDWQLTVIDTTRPIAAPTGVNATIAAGGASPAKTWSWVVTAVNADGVESLPSAPDSATGDLRIEYPATITWSAVTDAEEYRVYKGRNGVYGFIGVAVGTTFYDDNLAPVFSETPPEGRDPFAGAGNRPRVVAYHEQRQWFGGCDNAPQTLEASRTGSYRNFDRSSPPKDDDAITATIASRQVDIIRALIPMRVLIALTSGAIYKIDSGGEGPITPTTLNARAQSYIGAADLDALVVGDSALYVQAKGTRVRDLIFDYAVDGYTSNDLSILAHHLFRGFTIVDWTYAREPFSVVWCVRSDGKLLGLTYMREQEVWGWHQHETDGFVENVCAVSEGSEDFLYLVVRRIVGGVERRFVERMASRQASDVRDFIFLDCSVSYDGRNTGATTMQLTAGTTWQAGEQLTLTAGAAYFDLTMVGETVVLEDDAGERVRCRVLTLNSATEVYVEPQGTVPVTLRGIAVTSWELARSSFSGLDHLEGRTVRALADGLVHPDVTVTAGRVELGFDAAVVHVGLPYTSRLETLDLSVADLGRDRKKILSKVSIEVERSSGLWVGERADKLREWKQRHLEAYSEPVALATDLVEVRIDSTWNANGRIILEQREPLPLTVLSLIPEVTVGG